MTPDKRGFLEELKRRHVWRVAIAYAVAGWLLVQVVTQVFPFFSIPAWAVRLVIILIVIGFPVTVACAWIYELTPEGIRRTTPADSPDVRPQNEHRQIGRKLNAIIVAALVLAVALLGWRLFAVRHTTASAKSTQVTVTRGAAHAATAGGKASTRAVGPPPATSTATPIAARPIPAKSVAVLPFENLSADKNNAYFADGMQDLILTKLADIGDLKVIARTSTEKYGSHPQNLTKVGRQLGVATILEGSVQKAGKQVLINVQLIDAKTDSHIWAHSYTRTLDNIFGVEGEVATKVATALNAKLTQAEQHAIAHLPTTNTAAYTLYLKAVHQIHQFFSGDGKSEHVKQAVTLLKQAVAKDPDFALAYALLSRAQGYLQFNDIEHSPALARSELANARKAVALQPNLATAHDQLAVAYGANGMFDKAIPELETALRLDPTDEQTRLDLGSALMARGDWSRAKSVMAPVLRMNPTNAQAYTEVAQMATERRQYARAQALIEQGLAIAPGDQNLKDRLTSLFLLLGEPHKALQSSKNVSAHDGTLPALDYRAYMQLRQFGKALSAAQSISDGGSGLHRAGKELKVATAAQHTGDASLARDALKRARHAIAPYLQSPHAAAGMALAYQSDAYQTLAEVEMLSGHRKAAMQAARKAFPPHASSPLVNWWRWHLRVLTAIIAAHFGDAKAAVEDLQKILLTRGTGRGISVGLLRRDPTWDPIRHDPAFQALLKKYGHGKPARAASAPSP